MTDDEEDDDELAEDERRKRRRMREAVRKILEKSSKHSVPEGFEAAFSGQENAWKYYRHHDFKYGPEPKDRVPLVKPSQATGEYWAEPDTWRGPRHAQASPFEKIEAKKVAEPELPLSDLARIEADARLDLAPETEDGTRELREAISEPEKADQLTTSSWQIDREELTTIVPDLGDSVSPLELSAQHEKLRRKAIREILEEERQALLQDFDLGPEHRDS